MWIFTDNLTDNFRILINPIYKSSLFLAYILIVYLGAFIIGMVTTVYCFYSCYDLFSLIPVY